MAATALYYQRHVCRLSPWPDCVERSFAGTNTERIGVPALVTAGRHDEATPEKMRSVASELPNAQLSVFENSSHMAFVEERSAYIAHLRAFLRDHEG